MLKENMTHYMNNLLKSNPAEINLYEEEKRYAEKNNLLPSSVNVHLKDPITRFDTAYLERCEKESIALIIVETPKFLHEKLTHLNTHSREFLYVESPLFSQLGIDALSMEIDDVFGTYTALFGLKIKKQQEEAIKTYLNNHLLDERGKFSVAFSGQDGLWNMNIAVNYIEGFHADMTLLEAYELVYVFIFNMLATIEETK